jgi:hypothetical protein
VGAVVALFIRSFGYGFEAVEMPTGGVFFGLFCPSNPALIAPVANLIVKTVRFYNANFYV